MADYRKNDDGLWDKTREDICCIRELLAYDLECQINPEMKEIGAKRHLRCFTQFSDNHDLFENVDEVYLDIAKKYSLPISQRVLEEKHLFTSDWTKDTKTVNAISRKYRIESLAALPFTAANRFFSIMFRS